MYKIIMFKTYKGGGIGFLPASVTIEEMESFLLLQGEDWDCMYITEENWEQCEKCIPCNFQHRVESYSIIGEVENINTEKLVNYKDKFYYYGGDCC